MHTEQGKKKIGNTVKQYWAGLTPAAKAELIRKQQAAKQRNKTITRENVCCRTWKKFARSTPKMALLAKMCPYCGATKEVCPTCGQHWTKGAK